MHAVAPRSTPRKHTALLTSDLSLLSDVPLASDRFNAIPVAYPSI